MHKLAFYAAASVAALAMAPAANAAQVLTISGPSGIFGNDTVSGSFEREFRFDASNDFDLVSLDITSVATSPATDLDFTSVTFNGVEFNILATGRQEFRNLFDQALLATDNVIVVRGNAGSNAAFAGTLSFSNAAIPEPATWAMMIGGFGLVGGAMRRRARVTVAYA